MSDNQTPWDKAACEILEIHSRPWPEKTIRDIIKAACLEHAAELQREVERLKEEDVRRIRHLNRLGSWAQQDPTGPLPSWMGSAVQQWVLEELKAALGTEYRATSWQPSYLELRDERDRLAARVERLRASRNVMANAFNQFAAARTDADRESAAKMFWAADEAADAATSAGEKGTE